jgi:RimJ/RimL family protein N-acetyltransferase
MARALHPPVAARLGDVSTERLDMLRLRPEHAEALTPIFAEPAVWEFPYGRGLTASETDDFARRRADEWRDRGFGCWLLVERATGRALGYAGLIVPVFLPEVLPAIEVGWRLDPAAWGRGYATEAGRRALDEAFRKLGLPEVCSIIQPENVGSVRVAERLGLTCRRAATVPASGVRPPLPVGVYAITRDEWPPPRAVSWVPPPGRPRPGRARRAGSTS